MCTFLLGTQSKTLLKVQNMPFAVTKIQLVWRHSNQLSPAEVSLRQNQASQTCRRFVDVA